MSPQLYEKLKSKFPRPEYVLMQEVRDAAGFNASRSADAMAIGLWQSRGYSIIGMEVKASRSDWLRELKNPKKAENIYQYCNYWWLLCENPDVAKLEEIPLTWGCMVLNKSKLSVLKPAPILTPVPVTNTFLAAMMKRITDGMISRLDIADEIKKEKDLSFQAGKAAIEWDNKNKTQENERLKELIKKFEESSGVKLDSWRGIKNIGEAVKSVMEHDTQKIIERIEAGQKELQRISEQMQLSLEKLKAIENGRENTTTNNL